jgi:hypothetical protein
MRGHLALNNTGTVSLNDVINHRVDQVASHKCRIWRLELPSQPVRYIGVASLRGLLLVLTAYRWFSIADREIINSKLSSAIGLYWT